MDSRDCDLMARFYESPEQYSHCAFKGITMSSCESKPSFRMVLISVSGSETVLLPIYSHPLLTADYTNLCAQSIGDSRFPTDQTEFNNKSSVCVCLLLLWQWFLAISFTNHG